MVKYLIKQQKYNGEPHKLIAIRNTREEAKALVDYLSDMDKNNIYFHCTDQEIPSDTR